MSRTGEIVLTIIGALIYGFFTVVGGFMVWLFNNEAIWDQAKEEINQQQPELAPGDMEAVTEMFQGSGWFLIILTIISVILGIVSIVFMKGNKKPKAAGIILIVTAALSTIITFGGMIFSGIFYLIAGIMCLARKAPAPATQETVE
ncbi:MAG TPA: DUF4064 domain-containing protein [Lentibacillus sp.]|uniref:DUF4064 domain-containing protein n=1 Tax=Lentibacillus sp. TaxID=1925746 RepID=UPI002B4B4FA1|nr:DUF4064 domain-containing protein [Lentibacillus sp.]HLR63009.1 DUF4064 domain-containing protein [Lentibacillus sp.]